MAKSKEAPPAKDAPSHGVYVVEGEGDRAFWTRIGSAWQHGDDRGLNVQVAGIPLTGRLVIRARTEKEQ